MDYLVGDVQGCAEPLDQLLSTIDFSPSRDRLVVLGDLVNRGPDSLGVLRRLRRLGDAAICLLGNHDLHLLAVAAEVRAPHRSDTLDAVLHAPDRGDWLAWLRARPLACHLDGWLCVHAGVVPQWDLSDTLTLAAEAEAMIRGPDWADFVQVMYGDEPARWSDDLMGHDRMRFVINVLTRIRFCDTEGRLEFRTKSAAATPPPGYQPWYRVPGRRSAGTPIAFGHWSTLGLVDSDELLALDTGCVWGGCLSAARVDGGRRELIQVPCAQARRPGR